jgi:hypothetical protein
MAIRSERAYVHERADTPGYPDYVERDVQRAAAIAWSPAQLIGLVVGVGFTVLGIVAVVRTGFDTSHIYTPRVIVWHLAHNPLLAMSEIGFGVLMIIASVVPGGLRTLMGLLGAAALVLGIVVLAGPSHRLTHWLGVGHSSGLFFTIIGAVVVLAAVISPVFFTGGQRRFSRVRTID